MSERDPKVTLCVPTIGRTQFLEATKLSVENQSFRDFEVLLLDNATPPEARALLERWQKEDPRVKLLRTERRLPMFENFNRGIHAARGRYLAFCHDDDILAEDFLQRHISFLDANPTTGFSGSNYSFIDEQGMPTEHRFTVRANERWRGKRYIRAILRSGRNPLAMQTICYRTEAIPPEGIDPQLPIHFGDFVFLMRIAERWDVGLIPESLVMVRKHQGQFSNKPLSESIPIRTEVLNAYVDERRTQNDLNRREHAELKALIAFAHRASLAWGWMSAPNDAESRACLEQLGHGVADRAMSRILQKVEDVAPISSTRRQRWIKLGYDWIHRS